MHRKFANWLLPVLIVLAGAYFAFMDAQGGARTRAALRPAQWIGVAALVCGFAASLLSGDKLPLKLVGVLVCGIGAVLVIYL